MMIRYDTATPKLVRTRKDVPKHLMAIALSNTIAAFG